MDKPITWKPTFACSDELAKELGRSETLTFDAEPDPVMAVGTPIYGETTKGEPFTLYVTEVGPSGEFRIGPKKP